LVAALSTRAERDWALYAAHRARLTAAIAESSRLAAAAGAASGEGRRLCVLGAGQCNDLDLERLAESFAEIHLVDIDGPALSRAVARQPASVRARLHRHGGVDLSGLSPRRLARWKRFVPDAAEIEAAAGAALDAILTKVGESFELVASTCVLTQMSFALREALGERHPALGRCCYDNQHTSGLRDARRHVLTQKAKVPERGNQVRHDGWGKRKECSRSSRDHCAVHRAAEYDELPHNASRRAIRCSDRKSDTYNRA